MIRSPTRIPSHTTSWEIAFLSSLLCSSKLGFFCCCWGFGEGGAFFLPALTTRIWHNASARRCVGSSAAVTPRLRPLLRAEHRAPLPTHPKPSPPLPAPFTPPRAYSSAFNTSTSNGAVNTFGGVWNGAVSNFQFLSDPPPVLLFLFPPTPSVEERFFLLLFFLLFPLSVSITRGAFPASLPSAAGIDIRRNLFPLLQFGKKKRGEKKPNTHTQKNQFGAHKSSLFSISAP